MAKNWWEKVRTQPKSKWLRIPLPGKMEGGNLWTLDINGVSFAIAKDKNKFYLTAAVGFMGKPRSIANPFDTLKEAKEKAIIFLDKLNG